MRELLGRPASRRDAVLAALAGIVVLAYPFDSLVTLTLVVGIWLIIIGIFEIISGLQLRHTGHEVRNTVNEVLGTR